MVHTGGVVHTVRHETFERLVTRRDVTVGVRMNKKEKNKKLNAGCRMDVAADLAVLRVVESLRRLRPQIQVGLRLGRVSHPFGGAEHAPVAHGAAVAHSLCLGGGVASLCVARERNVIGVPLQVVSQHRCDVGTNAESFVRSHRRGDVVDVAAQEVVHDGGGARE